MKLHLGCGKRFLSGYYHVDTSDYDHVDYQHEVRELPFIKDESVELIYASHVLEYFDSDEIQQVLLRWKRKLVPGGILRLAVPDFFALTRVYSLYENIDLVEGPIFGHWISKVWSNKSIQYYHKQIFDYRKLENLLTKCGFNKVRKWDWREVFVDELEGFDDYSQAYIPHMDKEKGILISLNVECNRAK